MQISHKNNNFDIKLGLLKINSDGFSAQVPSGEDIDNYEDDGYKNTTINLKTGLNFDENNRLEFTHNKLKANSEYDKGSWGATVAQKANGEGYELETRNSYSSLSFSNKNSFSSVNAYVNYSEIDRNDPKGFTKEFDGTLREYGINTTIPYNNEKSFIQTGIDYKITNHKNDVQKELDNKAIFVTNSTSFDNSIFTQSLRYDKFDLFKNKTTGKIGLKHNLNDDLSLSANYGMSYNVPTFYKLYDSGAGYSELQPETTRSSDVSLAYKNLSLTYFYNTIENMIEYNSTTYKYYNMDDEVTLQGIEIGYKDEIIEELLGSINYTYTSAKDNNDKRLQRRAKDSVKIALDYYGINKFHFNLNAEYVGDREQYDFGTYKVSANTGNYTLWNSVINYEINKTFKAYLKLDNITNKRYQTIDTYGTAERSGYVGLKATF